MRDPIKLLRHRASKVPAIKDFIENIDKHTLEEIQDLDIKKSDKKLLRTHFARFMDHHKEGTLNAMLVGAIKNMPTNDEVEMYAIYIYEGPETTYNGYEIRTGDVVTVHNDWIRFDYYRIKIQGSIKPIMDYCKYLDTMDIHKTNHLIFNMLNHRNGGSTVTSGDQYAVQPFRITRH